MNHILKPAKIQQAQDRSRYPSTDLSKPGATIHMDNLPKMFIRAEASSVPPYVFKKTEVSQRIPLRQLLMLLP
jgi:hypothetical protein